MAPLNPNAGRLAIALGAGNAFLAVALGAFGAHGLRHLVDTHAIEFWQTATHYHGFHGLGLLLLGNLQLQQTGMRLQPAVALLGTGILLFSGSLYALALTGITWLGAITPLGGLCFLAGWLWLALAAARRLP